MSIMNTPNITIYILFFVALITTDSNAQLLDTNTIWSERGKKYSYVVDDTLTMNNKLYHRINKHTDTTISYANTIDETYLIRIDGDSVMRYDQFRNEDVLIYDFSLSVEDTITVYPLPDVVNDSVLLRCENVDTVSVMGIQRRRLTMRTLDPDPYYQNDIEYWYWGIGSDLGLLMAGRQGVPMALDSYAPHLYCCHKVFDQVYQTSLFNGCHNTASIENHNLNDNIELYPNPIASGQTFTIKIANDQVEQIRIFNFQGKQIFHRSLKNKSEITIDKALESGVYLILLYDDSSILHRQKLVIK